MIIKVDKKERDNFEKACAHYSLDVKFFTMETNNTTVQAEVLDRGREISLFEAYALGRDTGMKKVHDHIFPE